MSDTIARLNAALEGRYALERELGEGGMATVYLAEDIKHNRKVALKVLKPELAAAVGAERFLAEIQVTAKLQHPNILPLHDSGEAGGFLFYVMPYVEGDTLRDRLNREYQLPVDEAVKLTMDVAEALQAAHEQGVIHRDIKPSNILISRGKPLISDFGIALALSASGAGERITETGQSLGTPHYMSPEQATGGTVGASTDTRALGCVLYEMLVGQPPYTGKTTQVIAGKILAGKPVSAKEHRPSVPANVDAAISKALEKLPADRFSSAKDFVRALGDEHFRYGELVTVGASAVAGPWNHLTMALAALAAVTSLGLGWSLLLPEPPKPALTFPLAINEGQIPSEWMDLSPDGLSMVFTIPDENGQRQLWLRRFDELGLTPIPGTEGGAIEPRFSPNGEEVAFVQGRLLKAVRLEDGLVRNLAEEAYCCISWGPDEFIYYTDAGFGISRVPVTSTGGIGRRVLARDETDGNVYHFQVLPGGEVAVFGVVEPTTTRIEAMRLDTRERKEVFEGGIRPYYTSTGHLVFGTRGGKIRAAPFDPEAMELTAAPLDLIQGVFSRSRTMADVSFSLSDSGTLVYWLSPVGVELTPMWVERDGTDREINGNTLYGNPNATSLALSPDGDRLAMSILDVEGRTDLWVMRLDTGQLELVTTVGQTNRRPIWSDSQYLTFISNREGPYEVWTKRADVTGTVDSVLSRRRNIHEVLSTPDNAWLIFREGGSLGTRNILALHKATNIVHSVVATEYDEHSPAISPNGRWLAYVTDVTGPFEVYVSPFPNADSSATRVSTAGGVEPVWSHNSQELFYVNGANQLVAAQFSEDPSFVVGHQEELFDVGDYLRGGSHAQYDVSADGQRFVMLRIEGDGEGVELILYQNWFTELERRVPN